jgi:hypothetical protein
MSRYTLLLGCLMFAAPAGTHAQMPKLHYMGLGVNTNIWLRPAPVDHSSSRSGN